nr:MAG TPA: hypothetical protein [Caudoviricetes sp.]
MLYAPPDSSVKQRCALLIGNVKPNNAIFCAD